jgi:AraC family transcriptional regulator
MSSIIHIKNMVCPRCITAVEVALKEQGLHVLSVALGQAEVDEISVDFQNVRKALQNLGFELLRAPQEVLTDQVRTCLLEAVHQPDQLEDDFKLSSYLETELKQSYYLISRAFSQTEKQTIEKFFIKVKVEKAKELITYDELSVKEIAARLGYSSVQYFYAQFKQVSGHSVKEYKGLGHRSSFDSL